MNALFVANFPSNTGYAWDTIEAVWCRVADHLAGHGARVHFAYASLADGEPAALRNRTGIHAFEADYGAIARGGRPLLRFLRLLRTHRIELLYLTDQPTWSPLYPLFRLAGVRTIVVHDRTSGDRVTRGATSRAVKRALHYTPLAADRFIGVSDFVAQRLRDVNGTPPQRTFRVHNGIDLSRYANPDRGLLSRTVALPPATATVVFAGRLRIYKGVDVLLDAVQRLQRAGREVALILCGDGPDRAALEQRARELELRHAIFLGKRRDIADLIAGADVAVVPSTWAEAFGLTVVEAMAAGVPLVATCAGAIPEIVEHGSTAQLVEPGNADALAAGIAHVLDDRTHAWTMAAAARERAFSYFDLQRTARELAAVLLGHAPQSAAAPVTAASARTLTADAVAAPVRRA